MSELATAQPDPVTDDFSVTGGSDPDSENLISIRRALLGRLDVIFVHDVKPHPTEAGVYLYFVETRHQFPKFVIGRTGLDLESARPLLRCGLQWSACDYWTNGIELL
jgi:hypothetical protein